MKTPARTRRANGSSAWPLPRGTAALPTWSWPTTCWATAPALPAGDQPLPGRHAGALRAPARGCEVHLARSPGACLRPHGREREYGISAPSTALRWADLDGDGHLEFVCGNYWFKREGASFACHRYCNDRVSCRVALGDVDGKDDLEIVVCERAAIAEHELSGATLSVFRQGVDICAPWEEQVLSDNINDCGVLIVGNFTGAACPTSSWARSVRRG